MENERLDRVKKALGPSTRKLWIRSIDITPASKSAQQHGEIIIICLEVIPWEQCQNEQKGAINKILADADLADIPIEFTVFAAERVGDIA